ncbi:transcriptional regulator swi6, partial [Linderina pennispora]
MDSVYTAVYSGIPVYEMICRSIAVMRRHSDSWLNATQILKVAGIEKGRRTKILEREVLNGEHNKIQGGYGKYQGTWVPYARGVQLCQQYGVYDFMRPILEHDPTESGTRPDRTPTKAEVRKRLRDSSQQRSSSVHGLPSSVRRDRVPDSASTKRFKPSSSNATSPINSELGGSLFGAPQVFTPHADAVANGSVTSYRNLPYNSSPAVRPGGSSTGRGGYQTHNEEASSATVTDSDVLGNGVRVEQDRMLLMNIFLKEDQSFIPEWLSQVDEADDVVDLSTKVNVNLVIDDQGHTAVHWAAALARTHVLDLLLFHGADARKVNYEGESALVRAVQVTNNYENQTFMELLELLHDTIPLTDKQNRTVLHHISLAAGIDGREKAARYYADCLLQWIAGLADGYQVDGADTNAKQEISSDLQPP